MSDFCRVAFQFGWLWLAIAFTKAVGWVLFVALEVPGLQYYAKACTVVVVLSGLTHGVCG